MLLGIALGLAALAQVTRIPHPVALVLGGVTIAFIPGERLTDV